jgi:tripartite ATP-independent transporter DctM subunit
VSVDWIVAIALGALVLLLLLEMPVAFALAGSGSLGLILLRSFSVTGATLASLPYQSTASYTLSVVPMFIFMGLLAMHGNIAEDLFRVVNRLFRGLPGGVGLATVATCAGFAAVTGSSVATAATVGRLTIDEMRRYGYQPGFAAAIVGAAGTLGVLIPPSIVLVLFGIITNESISKLLIAGVIPGILSAAMLGASVLILARYRIGFTPEAADARAAPAPATEDARPLRFGGIIRLAILFLIVIGGIYSGIVTATEAAAIGALAALAMLVWRALQERGGLWPRLVEALKDTAAVTSMVFAILVGASILSYFLVSAGVPSAFTEWVLQMNIPPHLLVFLLLAALIPLGMFLDAVSILLITVPLSYPVIVALGFNGLWYAVLVVKMIELGLITPPLGVNAFVVTACTKDSTVEQVFRGLLVFMAVDLIIFGVLFMLPELTTWLPSKL